MTVSIEYHPFPPSAVAEGERFDEFICYGVIVNKPESRGTRVRPTSATPPPAMSCVIPK